MKKMKVFYLVVVFALLAISVILFSGIAQAGAVPDGFMGVPWGASKDQVIKTINRVEGFRVEYFEIADDRELKCVNRKSEMMTGKRYFGCIAVRAGKIRLIDNIEFPLC